MEEKIFTESPYIIPITDEEIKNFIRETPRSPGVYKFLDKFKNQDFNILLGTQMIAKGLDFENVTFVGIINADVGLFLPDFRAGEKIFQLIYFGNGGFTHSDIYDMPVYLRNFYYRELVDTKKEENKQSRENHRKNQNPKVHKPNIQSKNPRFK